MSKVISIEDLKELFTKPYGKDAPTKQKWIEAQEKLVKRCDDLYIETHAIAINGEYGFVEWTMGLKIMGKTFIYPGTTRLIFSENGLIKEHRDYFDFCGPTFGH